MGGSGQGLGRGRRELRGRVNNGRYDKVRSGGGGVAAWGNRWQVLDQTGEDLDMSIEEIRRERIEEVREERRRVDEGSRNDGRMNEEVEYRVGFLRRVGQPGGSGEDLGRSNEENGNERREQVATGAEGGRNAEVGETARKRNLQDRSPGQHEDTRTSRPRLDEFEIGKVFEEMDRRMKTGMAALIEGAPEEYKETLRKGFDVMVEGMKSVMNGTSDCVAEERRSREAENMRMEDRIEKLDEKMDDLKRMSDNIAEEKMKDHVRASEREMEDRVKHASCCLKLLDIDFGKVTEDRMWIVRSIIKWLRDDIHPQNVERFDRIMRRTRVQILGRGTAATSGRGGSGRTIYTVPILLECQSKIESGDLDAILKDAGYFSTFHWPSEMMEFVNEARQEMRKAGYEERTHYVRIRPEERGGELLIRADVKEKNGGRWQARAFWQCPPMDRNLWELITGIFVPRMVGRRE
jgi:hypothetical protein